MYIKSSPFGSNAPNSIKTDWSSKKQFSTSSSSSGLQIPIVWGYAIGCWQTWFGAVQPDKHVDVSISKSSVEQINCSYSLSSLIINQIQSSHSSNWLLGQGFSSSKSKQFETYPSYSSKYAEQISI